MNRNIIDQHLFVYQNSEYYLHINDDRLGEPKFYFVSYGNIKGFAGNEITRLLWDCCSDPIRVSDLVDIITDSFDESSIIESDILSLLLQCRDTGLLKFAHEQGNKTNFSLDYRPEFGTKSDKGVRLVDFCLGDYKDKPVVPCSGRFDYLRNEATSLLEVSDDEIWLTSSFVNKSRDTKKIIPALISQRAVMPEALKCWIVGGDSCGRNSQPEQGVHVAGMRRAVHRHLVLVPSSCRERYLGAKLQEQMDELRQSWVPWEEKADTAWWGGALTGHWWKTNEPKTITRGEVLSYYRDNPSEKVRLDLTELPPNINAPSGIELKGRFTKQEAFKNKCLIMLPGNDIASSSSWYFCGNSVVLMPTPHLEHILYFEMEPWVHYVPITNDPADILVKLQWVLDNEAQAKEIVANSHQRLRWLCGPEYLWACNEILRRIAEPSSI